MSVAAEQRRLRDGLEIAIKGLLMEFESKADLTIRDVHLERTHEISGKSGIHQVYIDTDLGRLSSV